MNGKGRFKDNIFIEPISVLHVTYIPLILPDIYLGTGHTNDLYIRRVIFECHASWFISQKNVGEDVESKTFPVKFGKYDLEWD